MRGGRGGGDQLGAVAGLISRAVPHRQPATTDVAPPSDRFYQPKQLILNVSAHKGGLESMSGSADFMG